MDIYAVELSAAAVADLDDFSDMEQQEIFGVLLGLEENPRPAGVQPIPFQEAADRTAYLIETETYSLFYDIFETARVVKVVAIFKRVSLNWSTTHRP